MVNILILESAITHASEKFILRPDGWNDSGNAYWESKVYPKDMIASVVSPFEHAMRNTTPEQICIVLTEKGTTRKVDPDGPFVSTAAFAQALQHLTEPIFLAFFERYNVWLTANLGDAVDWPPCLNFARVIRNAVAHGAIDIRNAKTPPAMWNGLSYSHADNGKKILGVDLNSTDLIGLMFDVDEALDRLGAPIL